MNTASMTPSPRAARPRPAPRAALALLGLLLLPGCETARSLTAGIAGPSIPAGTPGFVQGFLGGVAAEEPVAASIARDVLSAGGNAADAAVAAAFAMSVTYPSRVGLGGGGACLVYDVRRNEPEAVLFLPGQGGGGGDRPAAVPLLARGLFAVHSRLGGGRPFEELLAPAEQLARFGAPMSRALHADLTAVRAPLFADAQSRAVFGTAEAGVIPVGERFRNAPLAGTLSAIRLAGAGDFHQGALARRIEESSPQAGGPIAAADLRAALPRVARPILLEGRGGDRIAFLPPPADGGLAAAAAFRALQAGQGPAEAQARAIAAAAMARREGGEPMAILAAAGAGASLPPLPASAGLVVYDRNGNAVSCAFTLNNLFGTGRMVPGMGFLLAAAPNVGRVQPPLLSAAIAWAPVTRAFKMAAAGSGQEAAPLAVAAALETVLLRERPAADAFAAIPEPGRAQIGACPRYLPGWPQLCTTVSDPRGAGVALGATGR